MKKLLPSLTAAFVVVTALAGPAHAAKKLLLFTKSVAWEHPIVARTGNGLSFAGVALTELAQSHGWTLEESKDGAVISAEGLKPFDAIIFITAGDLDQVGVDHQPAVPPGGKAALLAAVNAGKGFVGLHCASDTYHSPEPRRVANPTNTDPYIAMLGGEFIAHSDQQPGTLITVDPRFPGLGGVGPKTSFQLEEWYGLKNFAPDLHVLLMLDTAGMKGVDYERPPFPLAWVRRQGKGKVFFTGLAHREDTWQTPFFREHVAGGLAWVLGEKPAKVPPNLKKVAPGAHTLPPLPPPK